MIARRALLLALPAALAAGPALAAKVEKKKGGGASFIQVTSISATIIRRDGRRGIMTMECGLDVSSGALRDRAEASEPRLRAAYAQLVRIYAAGLPTGAPPDADYLARELQRETDRVLGKKGAKFLVGTILVN